MGAQGQIVTQVEQRELVEFIDQTVPVTSLVLDLFFPNSTQSQSSILLEMDIYKGPRPLAGWVAPNSRAVARDRAGFINAIYQLPYLKEARQITPENLRKRMPQKNIYGDMSKTEAIRLITSMDMLSMRDAIRRRFEFAAIQQLTTGKVIIKSDTATQVAGLSVDTPQVDAELSINQSASHRLSLTGTVAWSDPTSNGGLNIENSTQNMIKLLSDDSGIGPDVMIIGWDAFTFMRKTQQVRTELNQTQPVKFLNIGELNLDISPKNARRDRKNGIVKQIGTFQGLDVWLYAATYQDNTGAVAQMFPSNGCLIGSTSAEGSIDYGALESLNEASSNFLSVDGLYPKQLAYDDPESLLNILQVRGCPIMREPDAFGFMTVG